MAINIKFDLVGNPEPPTIILANRNGNKLGQLRINSKSIELIDRLNDASEFSFTINKYIEDEPTPLWDKVVDFKLAYCKEWDTWFEITVKLDEETETVKTVFCTQLGQAELSQIMLYNIEINTEDDILRADYKIAILYDNTNQDSSILHRLLKDKAPHYSVIHVDSTIANIQRSFSFDGISIYDALQEIAEEIGCIFIFHSNSDEHGNIQRTISVYDLQQNCLNNECNHRGEFIDVCPECGSKNIKYGYGEDTLIFVTSDELASDNIQLTTDTDSVKNCFKLEAGDDLMTATIRNCNPNGTDYIWRFSDDMKEDMPDELVEKIESYDDEYNRYHNSVIIDLDTNLLTKYNSLVNKYSIYNEKLQQIVAPITGYSSLMNAYYNTIDLEMFLKSVLMPSVKMSKTNAEEQSLLLTDTLRNATVAVANIKTVSSATADNTVLSFAKTIVKSTYKVQIGNSSLSEDKTSWSGNFIITNYSDDEDNATSINVDIRISGDYETFVKQKIEKALNKENTDDISITGLFKKDYNNFCSELKKYALNPLISFREACQACIDILIQQDIGSDVESDLYKNLYEPYYNKLMAIEAEIAVREEEIGIIVGLYDIDDKLLKDGLQTNIESHRDKIRDILDFEKYLGEKLWLEFCSYRREDKYSNDNYISDGLDNNELFKMALEFFDVAEKEIYKASELQHSISTTLKNLLAIPKFKTLIDSFKVGNWIRIQLDNKIYKLRLIEYTIDFSDFDNISVEFSDVTKIKNGVTDVESVLSQASSMASSYSSVKRQAGKFEGIKGTINDWVINGLNNAHVRIQNNNNEEVTMTKSGLICRTYDDVIEDYDPEQFRLTHNIMAYTDDNWKTVRHAIGKHDYVFYDENQKMFANKTGYGITADFMTAGIVSGSQIIGGDIYSSNYSNDVNSRAGSHLNLTDGTFSFAGGNLTYDTNRLYVNGEINATSGTIGGCDISNGILQIKEANIAEKITANSIDATNLKVAAANVTGTLTASQIDATDLKVAAANITGTLTAAQVNADNLKVKAANITGQITASQINTTGLIAENISATTITGKTITGGSINIGNGVFSVGTNGSINASQGSFGGTLNGVSGSFTSLTAGSSKFTPEIIKIDASSKSKGAIHIGYSNENGGYTDSDGTVWDDITIRPSMTLVGNIGTPQYYWDRLCVEAIMYPSDRNLKKDILKMNEKQEQFFNLLSPVTYKFINGTSDRLHYGFISQEVEDAIIKSGITTKDFAGFCKDVKRNEDGSPVIDDDGNEVYMYSLKYSEFIALNTHMIQRLRDENDKLNKKIALLEEKIKQLL